MDNMETRMYQAVSRIDESLKSHIKMQDERHEEDRKQHDKMMTVLDRITFDLDNCPHAKLENTEKRLDNIDGRIDRLLLGFMGTVGLAILVQIILKAV